MANVVSHAEHRTTTTACPSPSMSQGATVVHLDAEEKREQQPQGRHAGFLQPAGVPGIPLTVEHGGLLSTSQGAATQSRKATVADDDEEEEEERERQHQLERRRQQQERAREQQRQLDHQWQQQWEQQQEQQQEMAGPHMQPIRLSSTNNTMVSNVEPQNASAGTSVIQLDRQLDRMDGEDPCAAVVSSHQSTDPLALPTNPVRSSEVPVTSTHHKGKLTP
jgi:hypothetical protein